MLISVLQWADIRHPLAAEIIRGFVKNLKRPAVATLEHWARELRRKVLDLIESDLEQMASCVCLQGPSVSGKNNQEFATCSMMRKLHT